MTGHAEWGPLITEVDVDAQIVKLLRTWVPAYWRQFERERELEVNALATPRPESITNSLDDEDFLDHALPAILVTTASTVGDPERSGNGLYLGSWEVIVTTVGRGRTPSETRAVASGMSACVRRMLTQLPLPTLPAEVYWEDGSVAPLADTTDGGRWLAAGINTFTVSSLVPILDSHGGPVTNPDGPYDPANPDDPTTPYDPLVKVHEVTVEVTTVPTPEEN